MPQRPKAVPHVHISEPQVRVTEWRFVHGAETGWHRHEADYVVAPDSALRNLDQAERRSGRTLSILPRRESSELGGNQKVCARSCKNRKFVLYNWPLARLAGPLGGEEKGERMRLRQNAHSLRRDEIFLFGFAVTH